VAESSLQQIANPDRWTTVLGGPRFEPDKIRVMDLNLGGIFDQEKPFIFWYQPSHGIQEARLRHRFRGNENILATKHIVLQPVCQCPVESSRCD